MNRIALFSFVFSLICVSSVDARDKCYTAVMAAERAYKIPKHLLQALSLVETGRNVKGLKFRNANPWVIQNGGKSHYFKTKQKAVSKAKQLIRAGKKNFDVGCLQLNYRYHGKEFDSIEHMLEPDANVIYAAKMLKGLRSRHKTWAKAIGHYHSGNATHNIPYRRKVYRAWSEMRVVERLKAREKAEQMELAQASFAADTRFDPDAADFAHHDTFAQALS